MACTLYLSSPHEAPLALRRKKDSLLPQIPAQVVHVQIHQPVRERYRDADSFAKLTVLHTYPMAP